VRHKLADVDDESCEQATENDFARVDLCHYRHLRALDRQQSETTFSSQPLIATVVKQMQHYH